MKLLKLLAFFLVIFPLYCFAATFADNNAPEYNLQNLQNFFADYYLLNSQTDTTGTVILAPNQAVKNGDTLYVRITGAPPQAGEYLAFAQFDSYFYPAGKTLLGQGFTPIAKLTWQRNPSANVAEFSVTALYQAVAPDAKVIAIDQLPNYRSFSPYYPRQNVCGNILDSAAHLQNFSLYQTLIISLGRADGLHAGALLPITSTPSTAQDPTDPDNTLVLPSKIVGTVMLYSLTDHLSLALVVQAKQELNLHNIICNVD